MERQSQVFVCIIHQIHIHVYFGQLRVTSSQTVYLNRRLRLLLVTSRQDQLIEALRVGEVAEGVSIGAHVCGALPDPVLHTCL